MIVEVEQFANVSCSSRYVVIQDNTVLRSIGAGWNGRENLNLARVELQEVATAALKREAKSLDQGSIGRSGSEMPAAPGVIATLRIEMV